MKNKALAQELVQHWFAIPSEVERRKAMQVTQSANPQVYALAKEMVAQTWRKGGTQ